MWAGVDVLPKGKYFAAMKNYKNLLIALLTGLLALSLFTQPAGGASPKTSSIARQIEYKYCLTLHSDWGDGGNNSNELHFMWDDRFIGKQYKDVFDRYVSTIISACAPYKPAITSDAKAAQFEMCLNLGTDLRNHDVLDPDATDNPPVVYRSDNDGHWLTASYKRLIPHIQKVCAKYRP